MDMSLIDAFSRLLDDAFDLTLVRQVEHGEAATRSWEVLQESGFLDALVAEDHGGAGLDFTTAGGLVQAAAYRLVPSPFGETMVARALLANAGLAYGADPILLITPARHDGGWRAPAVAMATTARHALVDLGQRLVRTPLESAVIHSLEIPGSTLAEIRWPGTPPGDTLRRPGEGLRPIAAALRATEIAGAADRLLTMTTDYSNERIQFGKPIGWQQAIQQSLAVMAEQAAMARMAAQIGCAGTFPPTRGAAAVAKQVASAAALQITAIAHSVHGAIGFSEEHDLQLFTRRLHEWRLADGSEGYWSRLLGGDRLASDLSSLDFARALKPEAVHHGL